MTEYSVLLARVSRLSSPVQLEALEEIELSGKDEAEIRDAILDVAQAEKGAVVFSHCAVHPAGRFIRRASLDNAAKSKEPGFLSEYLRQQYNVDPQTHMVAVLNAADGSEFDPGKGPAKEFVFCGAPTAHIRDTQERLVAMSLYPKRMEIGTLGTFGAVADYCERFGTRGPVLSLELESECATIMISNGKQLDVARPISYGLNSMYPLIQKELGLKDQASARKLFTSNTFDFTEMGPSLLAKFQQELQASTGFYEVQTGQTISHLFLPMLPDNFAWIGTTLSQTLGVEQLKINFPEWLAQHGVGHDPGVECTSLPPRWFGLLGLLGDLNPARRNSEASAAKPIAANA